MARHNKIDYEQYIGKKTNRLTIICQERRIIKGRSYVYFYCLCDCGKFKWILAHSVVREQTTSCGCFHSEQTRKANRIENRYDISGPYGAGWTNRGVEFYFDIEDFEKIKKYCWCYSESKGTLYANDLSGRNKHITMQQLVYFNENNYTTRIDHINWNSCDNRKENLRLATTSQNGMNRSPTIKNSTGVIGIFYHKEFNSYTATITANKKTINLGTYKTLDEAIRARLMGEKLYYKEFAPQQYLFEKYGVT